MITRNEKKNTLPYPLVINYKMLKMLFIIPLQTAQDPFKDPSHP